MTKDEEREFKEEFEEIDHEQEELEEEVDERRRKRRRRLTDEDDVEFDGKNVRINDSIGWLGKFLIIIDKFGMKKLFQGLLLVGLFFTGDAIYHFVRSEQFMETVLESMEKKNKETHDEGTEVRGYVSPKINKILVKMVYEMHADRAFIIEMHNGKENASSLPFVFYDMTYEEIREEDGATYIQSQFENVNISSYQMPWYVAENTYFIGDVEEMRAVDRRFAARFEDEGDSYCGMVLIRSSGINVGFLGVAYKKNPEMIDESGIRAKLAKYVQDIAPLLDLNKAKRLKERDEE